MASLLQVLLGRKAKPRKVMGSPKPLLHHGALDRLPECLRTDPLTSVERVCAAYKGPVQGASGGSAHGVQVPLNASAAQVLGLGLTVYFTDLNLLGEQFRPFLHQLEDELGIPRDCAAIMGFSNAPDSGLALHHDHFDQILINLVGRKRLDVLENKYTQSPALQFKPEEPQSPAFALTYQDGFPSRSEDVTGELETLWMEPGSALYLPAGCFHASAGQTERTLTVVIQLRVPNRAELFTHFLTHWLTQSPTWRTRPYGAWRDGDPGLDEAVAELSARLPDLDLADAFAAWTLGQHGMGLKDGADTSHPWARYIRLPEAQVTLEERASTGRIEVVVRCGPLLVPRHTDRFFVTPDHREPIEWLLSSTRVFTRAELHEAFDATVGAEAIDALLSRLFEARVVRPVPVPDF